MRNGVSRNSGRGRRAMLGGTVGAIVGGVSRLAVALSFLYYVLNWGGPFFRQQGGVSIIDVVSGYERWPMLLLSTCFGLVAGGVGGATCRPLRGAAIGGGISGLFCVGLFVVPSNVAIGLSGGGVTDYSADQGAIAVGLLGMIAAGALAGGIGALAGQVASAKAETINPLPHQEPAPRSAEEL